MGIQPLIHLFLCLFFGDAISFLHSPDQLVALPVNDVHVVIGEFAPAFFHTPFYLFPLALQLIGVHWNLP
jgi:hypothetical protein